MNRFTKGLSFLLATLFSTNGHTIVGVLYPESQLPEQSCAIHYYSTEGRKILCSGTLLSQTQIKTAAHCEEEAGHLPTFVVCPNGENRKVIHRERHPNYKSSPQKNDIAILQVEEPFNIDPMNHAKNEAEIEELLQIGKCAIFGHGKDKQGNFGKLLGAKARIIPAPAGPGMLFIGISNYARTGDSGGGLNCKDANGEWVNVGTITQATIGLSVVEKLTPNLDWLNDRMD